jgi:hypothetical protein
MRHRTIALLSFAAASCFAGVASAAGFGANLVLAGPLRVVSTLTQNTSINMLAGLPIRVTMCTGAVETPVFVITSPTTVIATGSCYQIKATLVGVDTTRFEIVHTAAANGLQLVEFGGRAQGVLFDRTNPNPGTVNSLTGRDVAYLAGVGAWIMDAAWSGPVELGTRPVMNDLYNKLTLRFSTCFDTGDSVSFNVDTDSIG